MSLSFKIGGDLGGALRQLRKRQPRSHHAWAQSQQRLDENASMICIGPQGQH